MPILNFPRNATPGPGGWRPSELQHLLKAYGVHVANGVAGGWAFGETERGDPQLYLLSPDAEPSCLLSVSRLNDVYVLEDGEGHVVLEHTSLPSFAERVVTMLGNTKQAWLAIVACGSAATRAFYEDRVEPAITEYAEALGQVGPGFMGVG
jgi:hypothetical protein